MGEIRVAVQDSAFEWVKLSYFRCCIVGNELPHFLGFRVCCADMLDHGIEPAGHFTAHVQVKLGHGVALEWHDVVHLIERKLWSVFSLIGD